MEGLVVVEEGDDAQAHCAEQEHPVPPHFHPICACVGCLSEVHGGCEPCWSESSLVVLQQKPLCHRIGDAGVSVVAGGRGLSLSQCVCVCASAGLLYGHLVVFTPSFGFIHRIACADDRPVHHLQWILSAVVMAQPPLLLLVFIL